MNYLAHAYLSFQDPDLLVGNMISDFVKGKQQFSFPHRIQQGITLHRSIDSFTDHHRSTQIIKTLLRPACGHYGVVFADVIYDHFLATDPSVFSDAALLDFSQWVYETMEKYAGPLPEQFSRMLHYMKRDNWLYHYKEKWGIQKSFGGIVHRAKYLAESDTVYALFVEHYETMSAAYQLFFPEMVAHVRANSPKPTPHS